ncbi:hypothetical protein GCM10017771_37550 [Streptomyces capitiformicae]|uniref:Uncharacterized protein n=1 Tax=Streptomyces capitiformicae TaxID=2014920 RepID=A0A919GR56_9ACTN|nr:hypothetical protein GCM10017771_37550 [Streptomyces capitiformicae]
MISSDRAVVVFAFKAEADTAGLAVEVASGLALATGRMIAAAATAAAAAAARTPVLLVTRRWLNSLTSRGGRLAGGRPTRGSARGEAASAVFVYAPAWTPERGICHSCRMIPTRPTTEEYGSPRRMFI